MKPHFALLATMTAALCVTAAIADGRPRPTSGGAAAGARNSFADPSAVVAAEVAFARLAQDKGQWTAFAATAAPDAVMFEPQMVYAHTWLKGRANPAAAVRWQPQSVWSSCDGTLMVSHGAWQGAKATGYFTTIWQRQRDGRYKWILDHGDTVKEPMAAPEMISAQIADCPARSRRPPMAPHGEAASGARKGNSRGLPALDPARRAGQSDDGSLRWAVSVDPTGARNLSIDWKKDGEDKPALIEEVSAG